MKKHLLYLTAFVLLATPAQAQNVPPAYVPMAGLAGWWPLDSNANDVSGKANNGVAVNITYTTNRFGKSARAANFNGLTSMIEIAEKPSQKVQKITLSAWVFTAVSRYSQIVYKAQFNSAAGENYSFHNLGVSLKNNSKCIAGQGWETNYLPAPLPVFLWVHLCSTYDGKVIRSYINGQLVGSQVATGSIDTCNSNLRIGYSHQNGGNTSGIAGDPWDGNLDDIGLWNRALTEEEIFNLYQESLVVPASVASLQEAAAVRIWPNPAGEHITIEGLQLAGGKVRITNTMGQLVWSTNASGSLVQLSRSQLGSSGIYFVQVSHKNGTVLQTEKLLLQ